MGWSRHAGESHEPVMLMSDNEPATDGALPVACMPAETDRARRDEEVGVLLFAAVEERRELPDGCAFRFPADEVWLAPLVEFIGADLAAPARPGGGQGVRRGDVPG